MQHQDSNLGTTTESAASLKLSAFLTDSTKPNMKLATRSTVEFMSARRIASDVLDVRGAIPASRHGAKAPSVVSLRPPTGGLFASSQSSEVQMRTVERHTLGMRA